MADCCGAFGLLQLWVYSYATMMNGVGDQEDLRLLFDVLTETKEPELHRYWTQRERAGTRRLFRLVAEILRAIEAGAPAMTERGRRDRQRRERPERVSQ